MGDPIRLGGTRRSRSSIRRPSDADRELHLVAHYCVKAKRRRLLSPPAAPGPPDVAPYWDHRTETDDELSIVLYDDGLIALASSNAQNERARPIQLFWLGRRQRT